MQLLSLLFASALLFWCQVTGQNKTEPVETEPVEGEPVEGEPVRRKPVEAKTDTYAIDHYDKTSRYGKYNKDKKCWEQHPSSPVLPVDDKCQSAAVKLKIEYLLKKNPAVDEEIKEKYLHCALSYFTPVGLENVCPSEIAYPTSVKIYDKTCYIVKPAKQCLTYVKCKSNPGCSGSRRSPSRCLASYFRSFNVWVYCEDCGFKLIELSLPQCCSCNSYQRCAFG